MTNADGSFDTLPNGLTVTGAGGGPTVSAINTRGVNFVKGRAVVVEITGANFAAGAFVTVSGTPTDVVESATTFRSSSRLGVTLTVSCNDFELGGTRDITVTNSTDGKSDTLENALVLRDGITINELISEPVVAPADEIEVFNGRAGCGAVDLNGYRVEFLTAGRNLYAFGVPDGNTIESYSTGHSITKIGRAHV